MSALPPNKDFTADGMPADLRKALEPTLLRALNEFARPVRALLNRGLGTDNFAAQVLTKRVVLPADYDADSSSVASCWGKECEFATSLQNLVGVEALGAVELDDSNAPRWDRPVSMHTPAARLVKSDGKTKIRIEQQGGLVAGRTYQLTWRAWGA